MTVLTDRDSLSPGYEMTTTKNQIQIYIDPDLLQLVGQIAEMFGLAEHIERILKTPRRRVGRRHRTINSSWSKFRRSLIRGRGAIRQIRGTLAAQLTDAPPDTVAIAMAYDDFMIFNDGVKQLHMAIGKMFDATYELEAASEPISDEVVRFYRVNEAGRPLLEVLKKFHNGHPEILPELLVMADRHFSRCERLIQQRREWLSS